MAQSAYPASKELILISPNRIAAILAKVDEEIEKVELIIGQTEKLKKGLMQKLLTGSVRVQVDERQKEMV